MHRNLKVWFVPTLSGDYRLEVDPKNPEHTILTVEDPTPGEITQLRRFLEELRHRGAVDVLAGISHTGRSEVAITRTLAEAANLLVLATKTGATWTAVRAKDGAISLVTDAATPAEVLDKMPDAVAAVTVNPVGKGCPPAHRVNRRASEVLRTFCTASQWANWQKDGTMTVVGGLSGRRYRLLHRDVAALRGRHYVLHDEDGVDVCTWDHSVAPEEEALAIKLTLEHHEGYLLGRHGDDVATAAAAP